jgi:hypothetical protein
MEHRRGEPVNTEELNEASRQEVRDRAAAKTTAQAERRQANADRATARGE